LAQQKRGFTLLELIITVVIISILAAVAIPMVETSIKREREIQLRRSLRTIRIALDEYKKFVEENKIKLDQETYNYPEKLEDLVEGITYEDKQKNEKIKKFLRRIPKDPMTNSHDWGMRSYQDDHDSETWGGENVYDVYTKSERKALDGSYYKDW
jgi:general secretion pathway protein G